MTNKRKKYLKEWREANKERQHKIQKLWRESNKELRRIQSREFDTRWPWRITWRSIQLRVKDKDNKYYYQKGIKNLLTMSSLRYIWNRDKAYNMENPRIHRKNSDGHYTVRNCVYIEDKEHASYHRRKTLDDLRYL